MADSSHSCCSSHASSCSTSARPEGKASAPPKAPCPRCGQVAAKVDASTVRALVIESEKNRVEDGVYYFCSTKGCDQVYFHEKDGRGFLRKDLSVRVGLKESKDPIPLCYCFRHTRASVQRELEETGQTTVVESIAAEIKAGRCECETKNPSGQCCLRTVKAAVKDMETG